MEICHRLEDFVPPAGGVVLSIGNFDGVHLGHAHIASLARALAARHNADVAVLTFDPHPLAVLAPERAPQPLTTTAEKLDLLTRLGVNRCILLHSEPALLQQEAGDFLARLVAHCRPRDIVEGHDFNFGRARSGSIATLQQHARQWNYEVHVASAVHCEKLPTRPAVSSSSIRQALRDGRAFEANAMLGRLYRITGTVGHGANRGVHLGFPTANLVQIPHLLPQEAIYAAIAQLSSGDLHLAAVNIGPQPTFAGETSRVEAHLLDFHGELRGQRLGLHICARLREQLRFSSPDALVAQIRQDVQSTRALAGQLAELRQSGPQPLC